MIIYLQMVVKFSSAVSKSENGDTIDQFPDGMKKAL